MSERRIVFDTNLFVSILLGSSVLAPLANLIRTRRIRLITSPAQIAELTEVIHRAKFKFTPSETQALLGWISQEAIIVTPPELKTGLCRDPKDDFLLTTALTGKAEALLTRDQDLLVLEKYQGISILSPDRFLETWA